MSTTDLEQLEARDLRVGRISFQKAPIYDPDQPGESKGVFRVVNRSHKATRSAAIGAQLVLREGDLFSAWALHESERRLRRIEGIRDPRIRPVLVHGDLVDLAVTWREAWTLSPQVDYDRIGDETTWTLGLEEKNLFGWNKELELVYEDELEDRGYTLSYQDPNLFLSRWTLEATVTESEQGHLRRVLIQEPFFSLDDRRGFFYEAEHAKGLSRFYRRGEVVTEWPERIDRHRVGFGFSGGRKLDGWTRRWWVGAGFQDEEFFRDGAAPGTTDDGLAVPLLPPDRRRYLYPFVRYEAIQDRFITLQYVDLVSGEPEDFNLGWTFAAGLGITTNGEGLFDASWGRGFQFNDDDVFLFRLEASGVLSHGFEDTYVGARALVLKPHHEDYSFLAYLQADRLIAGASDRQLLLGGEQLRGLPTRELAGDWRIQATFEERLGWRKELFHTFWVRPAFFADLGIGGPQGEGELFGSVGLSWRIEPFRFSKNLVLSFDLAYVFNEVGGVRGFQTDLSSDASLMGERLLGSSGPHRIP